MSTALAFNPLDLSVKDSRTWLFTGAFVTGNLILPQLCHLIPNGGLIFLPIYFFTLIAAYKFGLKVGLMTAIFSPLINSWLFGMPLPAMLPVILIKSCLLAVAAAMIARKSRRISLILIALVILSYQLLGGLAEWIICSDVSAALQDFRLGFPGMFLQLIGGWMVLKAMAAYER